VFLVDESDLGELYTSAAIRLHRSLEKTKEEVIF